MINFDYATTIVCPHGWRPCCNPSQNLIKTFLMDIRKLLFTFTSIHWGCLDEKAPVNQLPRIFMRYD